MIEEKHEKEWNGKTYLRKEKERITGPAHAETQASSN